MMLHSQTRGLLKSLQKAKYIFKYGLGLTNFQSIIRISQTMPHANHLGKSTIRKEWKIFHVQSIDSERNRTIIRRGKIETPKNSLEE